ncbi:MAG TPA: heavy metal-binding domain-containing protein [Chitinophagaceae bacterium]|nr:heavy metal-binding domain-containing protein [Chitinophagaceae bacterium]
MIDQSMVTTSINLDGYRVVQNLGVVRGIVVRSRNVFGNIAGGFKRFLGERYPSSPSFVKRQEPKHLIKWYSMLLKEALMRSSICGMMPTRLLAALLKYWLMVLLLLSKELYNVSYVIFAGCSQMMIYNPGGGIWR